MGSRDDGHDAASAVHDEIFNPIFRHVAAWAPGCAILEYVGRKSGRTYRIPVVRFRRGSEYVLCLVYGRDSQWVKNVLAAGGATIRIRRRTTRLTDPQLVVDPTPPDPALVRPTADAPPARDGVHAAAGGLTRAAARDAWQGSSVASYKVNRRAVAHAKRLIEAKQYVLNSDWGEVQPRADDENAYLENHSWDEYGAWYLGLTDGADRRPRPATRSCSATSSGSTARASSPATTAPPNGATRRSSSPPTTCSSCSTRRPASESIARVQAANARAPAKR